MIKKTFFNLKWIISGALLAISSTSLQAEPVDFSLPDIKGVVHKLSDYRGKWVVVNYWATWCPPCLSEIPELIRFHEKHKENDAVVMGIDFEDIATDELSEFIDSYFMSYPILRSKPAARTTLGIIDGLPTSFLISPLGEVIAKQTGGVTAQMIEEFMADQKKENKAEKVKKD